MADAYCTYFDHNYVPRAVLTLRSLRLYDNSTPVYVLALSPLCVTVLQQLALPNVRIIPLPTLEAAYPELETVKPQRNMIEYYFTLTPFLPHYLFATTDFERITYIDADLYFYSSPKPVMNSLRDAPVAITPHRFSFDFRNHIIYGRFNVAWITFRRCEEGLTCLENYKKDCTDWCYDRLEGNRFGDQKYLDAWPERYPSLKIIEHKGVNLAAWNADNYKLWRRGTQLMVDNDPLVFFHFSAVSMKPDGNLQVPSPPRHGSVEGVYLRNIATPYLARLLRERQSLHRRFPALAAAESELRYAAAPLRAATPAS